MLGTLDSLTRSSTQCSAVSIPGGPELVAANNANKILSISAASAAQQGPGRNIIIQREGLEDHRAAGGLSSQFLTVVTTQDPAM